MTKPSQSNPKHYVLKAETGYIRVTPFAYIADAGDFLEAAKQFKTSRRFSTVPYYLLCRSIELSLKCFLLGKGVSKKDLKEKYGHHLINLLTQARHLGIDELGVVLKPEYLDNLTKAQGYYFSKEFEYFEITKAVNAYPDLPELDALRGLASELVKQLKQFALDVA
jgi:hypothetical protein